MRLRFLPLLLALFMALPALARDFTYTYEGQTITYTVLDEAAKTVEVKQGDVVQLKGGNIVSGDLVLPAHPMEGNAEYTLVAIGHCAFTNCRSLNSVEIPNTITYIGYAAFFNCVALARVEIPNSVTAIEEYAFGNSYSLQSILIPNSVTNIGKFAFYGLNALAKINVELGNKFYSSEDGVLFNNDKTIIIRFPCGKGGTYIIPSSVITIEEGAFQRCRELISVEIPNSVTTIGAMAFEGCFSLTSIKISNSVRSIGNGAFEVCNALSSVTIPNSVMTIGIDAFGSCSNLCEINVERGNKNYSSQDGVLFNSNKTVLIQFPSGKGGFYSIPNSVTTIGIRAFCFNSAITGVEIPNSVTTMELQPFGYCTALTSVICWSKVPLTLLSNAAAFSKNEDSYLYVPAASVSAYENSDWAQYFTGIMAITDALTVNIGGNGEVYDNTLNAVESGSVFGDSELSFLIIPEAGNRIEAITMDGENVRDKLVGNKLTVRREAPESVLSIEFAPESEATLTVKGGDSYAATYTYTAGTAAVVKIQPESGWKLSSVSYNGADVTDQLDGNVYTTAPLEGENNLNFVLEKRNPTGVDEVGAPDSGVRVSVWHNTVTITGLEPGAQVRVHDVAGNMVYAGNDHSLTLPAGQAYIISTPSKTFKVAI